MVRRVYKSQQKPADKNDNNKDKKQDNFHLPLLYQHNSGEKLYQLNDGSFCENEEKDKQPQDSSRSSLTSPIGLHRSVFRKNFNNKLDENKIGPIKGWYIDQLNTRNDNIMKNMYGNYMVNDN